MRAGSGVWGLAGDFRDAGSPRVLESQRYSSYNLVHLSHNHSNGQNAIEAASTPITEDSGSRLPKSIGVTRGQDPRGQ